MRSDHDEQAVLVEHLGKRYSLGEREPYKTIRSSLASLPNIRRRHGQRSGREQLWALRDVSFSLDHGEALGVIGHNGAGKSTLLKLLSRVTAPTEGRAVLRGRASALLEIGTGFHPELTGRENVFLNGSILGMRQAEIRGKFDEIVAFGDVDIHRYPCQATFRAHAGEACLCSRGPPRARRPHRRRSLRGRGRTVSTEVPRQAGSSALEGRTVLFVSHNLTAIRALASARSCWTTAVSCSTEERTRRSTDTSPRTRVSRTALICVIRHGRAITSRGRVRLVSAAILGASAAGTIPVGSPISIRIELAVRSIEDVVVVLNIATLEDVLIAQSVTTNAYPPPPIEVPGRYVIEAQLEAAQLQPGRYSLGFGVRSAVGPEDHVNQAGMIEFVESVEMESAWFGGPGGYFRLPVAWGQLQRISDHPEGGDPEVAAMPG